MAQTDTRGDSEERLVESKPKKPTQAQPAFRHTPFRASDWEVIGERAPAPNFALMQCPILGESSSNPNFSLDSFSVVSSAESWSQETLPDATEQREFVRAANLAEEHTRQLAEQLESGHLAGYEEGYVVGKTESATALEELRAQASQFLTALNDESLATFQRMEKHAVHLAISIARKILITTADVRPDYILEIIREGLKQTGAAKPLRIRVSPADLEFIEVVGIPPELSTEELGVKYQLDESVKSGCIIETDFGDIDLQLEKMWEQIAASLYEVHK